MLLANAYVDNNYDSDLNYVSNDNCCHRISSSTGSIKRHICCKNDSFQQPSQSKQFQMWLSVQPYRFGLGASKNSPPNKPERNDVELSANFVYEISCRWTTLLLLQILVNAGAKLAEIKFPTNRLLLKAFRSQRTLTCLNLNRLTISDNLLMGNCIEMNNAWLTRAYSWDCQSQRSEVN